MKIIGRAIAAFLLLAASAFAQHAGGAPCLKKPRHEHSSKPQKLKPAKSGACWPGTSPDHQAQFACDHRGRCAWWWTAKAPARKKHQ